MQASCDSEEEGDGIRTVGWDSHKALRRGRGLRVERGRNEEGLGRMLGRWCAYGWVWGESGVSKGWDGCWGGGVRVAGFGGRAGLVRRVSGVNGGEAMGGEWGRVRS